jgi:hypothetical protein
VLASSTSTQLESCFADERNPLHESAFSASALVLAFLAHMTVHGLTSSPALLDELQDCALGHRLINRIQMRAATSLTMAR